MLSGRVVVGGSYLIIGRLWGGGLCYIRVDDGQLVVGIAFDHAASNVSHGPSSYRAGEVEKGPVGERRIKKSCSGGPGRRMVMGAAI